MKKLEFSTSKGDWLLVDGNDLDAVSGQALVDEYVDYITLSDITEEQASEVVGEFNTSNYGSYLPTWKDKLFALIKSKGMHLFENPFKNNPLTYGASNEVIEEAETKTFYNPFLFKKL